MVMNTATNPAHAAPDANRHHLPYLLAVVLAMAGLLWALAAEDPWGWLVPERVAVEIGEQHYLVPERELTRLSATRPEWLSDAEARAVDRLEAGVSLELDLVFGRVHERVPAFVDWYYSLSGATLRLIAAVPNPFWRTRGEFLTGEVSARLFPDDTWVGELEALDRAVSGLYGRELAALEARWLAWLAHELEPYRRDDPLPADRETLDLSQRLQEHLSVLSENDPIAIQSALGLGGGALLARGAIARVNARAASARAATRLASRGSATTGAAACGLTGPLAVGCGVLVFTGVILGTEWALLRLDEALNRDELEQALHESVAALRASMAEEYARPLAEMLESNLHTLATGVQGSLRPIDRIRGVNPSPE
jgi:hypothetical protein